MSSRCTPRPRPVRALLLCLAALLALPALAQAAYGGHDGAFAFVGIDGTGEPTVFVHGDGLTRPLLRGDAVGNPVFSPLGQRLAVNRDTPESGRAVWVMKVDGGDPRVLTPPGVTATEPTWSPGARSLAYAAGATGARTIHVIATNGLGDHAITLGPADQHSPAWSHHNRIAYVQSSPTGEDIWTIRAGGGTPQQLTFKPGDDTDPAWSPSGGQLAWVRGRGGVWVMNSDGTHAHRVVHVPGGIEAGVAWAPDGKRLLFAGGVPGSRRIYSVRLDGKGRKALTYPVSDGRDPDWRSVGHDPVIGAAGDIACDPAGGSFRGGLGTPHFCGMMRTSNLLLRPDLSAVLVLGDLQYPDGDLGRFEQSFNPTWGRLGSLLHPAPGNHEYLTQGAAGYFDYFNGPGVRFGRAGDRSRGGYYSFNVGTWHVIALDSNCGEIPGGCDVGSPEQRWLADDLATHRTRCTLAYWHHPLFSSLANEEGRGSKQTQALWATLYDRGADVVLSGHQHFYERLDPMDQDGDLDREQGIRSFVVGTGGKNIDQADYSNPNSADFDASTFGILQMTLHPGSYSWAFHPTSSDPYADSGQGSCH